MTVHHFGTNADGSQFLESPAGAAPAGVPVDAPQRPPANSVLLVRDWATQASLPSVSTNDYGYWDYSTQDIPVIEVSGGGGIWLAIVSIEARIASAMSGLDVTTALQTATAADVKASEALRLANLASSIAGKVTINGITASEFVITPTSIGARASNTPISTNDVLGLSAVATGGSYNDLTDVPALGLAGGVATLDDTGKVPTAQLPASTGGGGGDILIKQNADGTWPARNTKTSDPQVRVYYEGTRPGPTIGVDITTAYVDNRAAGIPGDRLRAQGNIPS